MSTIRRSRISRRTAALRERGSADAGDLAALEADVAVCLGELRCIIEDMKPTMLELFGFREAIESLLVRNASVALPGIGHEVVDSSGGAVDALPTAVRATLYRITQEAVNNAIGHSGATRIVVRIGVDAGVLAIEVADDGDGFDPQLALGKGGGVAHMSTRADLIRARVEIRGSSEGRGTVVRVLLPPDRSAILTH